MRILGKRARWYWEKIERFNYIAGRGNTLTNMFTGRFKGLMEAGTLIAAVEIIAQFGYDTSFIKAVPLWVIFAFAIGMQIFEFLLGLLDVKKMKSYQISLEVMLRDGINPWETEKLERIKDTQRMLLMLCEKQALDDWEKAFLAHLKEKKYTSYLESKK